MPISLTLDLEDRARLRVHRATSFARFGVDAFVTDRFGGVSKGPYESLNLALHVGDDPDDVFENRRRVAEAIDVSPGQLVFVDQVHGDHIAEAAVHEIGERADGIVSSRSDLALAIMVADCVPILLVDEHSSDFAVVHAGWRGLRGNVVANAVARFSDPSTVHALVGPSISAERYQVGPEVADFFRDLPGAVHPDQGDRSRLDLRTVAALLLVACGLVDQQITVCEESTDDARLFYSARGEQPCGRFALVARRPS